MEVKTEPVTEIVDFLDTLGDPIVSSYHTFANNFKNFVKSHKAGNPWHHTYKPSDLQLGIDILNLKKINKTKLPSEEKVIERDVPTLTDQPARTLTEHELMIELLTSKIRPNLPAKPPAGEGNKTLSRAEQEDMEMKYGSMNQEDKTIFGLVVQWIEYKNKRDAKKKKEIKDEIDN